MSAAAPIRVLVVDDSVVARRFITRRLEKDPELDVVGTASSGRIALDRIDRDPPDVVVLDDEMPEMTGRDVLRVLRKQHPEVAVVMFSARVGAGTTARFEALVLGADDAVAKPRSDGGPVGDDHPTWTELLTKAKQAARRAERGGVAIEVARAAGAARRPGGRPSPSTAPTARGVEPAPLRRQVPLAGRPRAGLSRTADATDGSDAGARRSGPPATRSVGRTSDAGCIVIASSTGGPDALGTVFGDLPGDLPLPVLVAQHMPPDFTRLLANRLDGRSALSVAEAAGGEPIVAGTAHVAPGGHHLEVHARHLGCTTRIGDGPPENSCRPAADVLLRTAVAAYGGRVLAVVLSGMGQDGLVGCEAVVAAGGQVVVQDEATSVVWGMPGAVARAGLAEAVLPIDRIAHEVTRRARLLALARPTRTVTGARR